MLHETTRKWICRRLFVACCLVPTLWVVGAVGYYHRPWRTATVSQDLSERLHATVTVGQTWQPRPGVTEYQSIQLQDLRVGISLLAADRMRADRRFGATTLRFGQVKLPETGLAPLVRLGETWLAASKLAEIHVQVDEVVFPRFHMPDQRATGRRATGPMRTGATRKLENLRLHGEPGTDPRGKPVYQLRAQAEYRTDGQVIPLRLMVKRQTVESRPHLHVTLDLSHGGIPGWMLHGLVPGRPIFQEAKFCGVIQLETDLQHLHGTLRGQLADLDLQRLLPRGARHQWSGRATIDWDPLTWQDGDVEEAQGVLRASRGTASRSLVADAVKLLYCQPAIGLGDEPTLAFDELACHFQLQAAGLTLWGECTLEKLAVQGQVPASQNRMSGCLLARRGKPLLWQSKYIVPVAQLVRLATSPTHDWTLPATREAQRLAQVLPLPGAPEVAEPEVTGADRARKE
jgi:hypothetical protein